LISRNCGVIPDFYRERLSQMGRFVAAYSRQDGTSPFLGDADDARTAPFGSQPLSDHRYLIGLIGYFCGDAALLSQFGGNLDEITWILGAEAAAAVAHSPRSETSMCSDFPAGGIYVLKGAGDHVFIDCGPIGLGGRGGHGHNDALSFEAALKGCHLITDCGSFLYTSDYSERNLFRSTSSHNTPQIDDEEINRFVHPHHLWSLYNDTNAEATKTNLVGDVVSVCAVHSGYTRLASPVVVTRYFQLDRRDHSLIIEDKFDGSGSHKVVIPLHLAPDVRFSCVSNDEVLLQTRGQLFSLRWSGSNQWQFRHESARMSPSYGVAIPIIRFSWIRCGTLEPFRIEIRPCEGYPTAVDPSVNDN
jgi:hypothetical protein